MNLRAKPPTKKRLSLEVQIAAVERRGITLGARAAEPRLRTVEVRVVVFRSVGPVAGEPEAPSRAPWHGRVTHAASALGQELGHEAAVGLVLRVRRRLRRLAQRMKVV